MNIQELLQNHYKVQNTVDITSSSIHTNISIQFAIKMLEELNLIEVDGCGCGEANIFYKEFENKIEELKKYL